MVDVVVVQEHFWIFLIADRGVATKFRAEDKKVGCPRAFVGDVVVVQEHFWSFLVAGRDATTHKLQLCSGAATQKFRAEDERVGCPRACVVDVVVVQEHFWILFNCRQGRGHLENPSRH